MARNALRYAEEGDAWPLEKVHHLKPDNVAVEGEHRSEIHAAYGDLAKAADLEAPACHM